MKTATVFKVECTKAYQAGECGKGYSLQPWGANTPYYEGSDDGGSEYIIPEGFEVAAGKDQNLHFYDDKGRVCPLISGRYGHPSIVCHEGLEIMLKAATGSEAVSGRLDNFIMRLRASLDDYEISSGLGNGDIKAPEWLSMSEDTDHIKLWDAEAGGSAQMGFHSIKYSK